MTDEPGRGRSLVGAVLVLAVLMGLAFWLAVHLGGASAVQDCVASGRRGC